MAGKASSIVTFTTTKDTTGVHNVDVNGVTGSFSVKAPPPPISWWLIAAIAAGVILVATIAWWLIRRRMYY